MDKDWMNLPRFSQGYIDGVSSFLDFAFTRGQPQGGEMLCPCVKCGNGRWEKRDIINTHLICYGFVQGYNQWVNHGEGVASMNLDGDIDAYVDDDGDEYSYDDISGLLNDRFGQFDHMDGVYEGPNEDAKKFFNLVEEAKQELYPGCQNFSTLSFTIRLYLLKCLHGWNNASFTALLSLMKEAMPHLNIPSSFNKTKAMIRDLGLDYKKIDACPNDCMLYWKEYATESSCYKCGASRWREYPQVDCELENSKKDHKVAAKTVRHFPIIPRLQRLFMCSKTAETLRWHEAGRSHDGKLRHPADGQSWKDFDIKHPDFAIDPRNIRLGLASDGFNPFQTMSISHSTWPVLLMVYNLPPWMCMKAEYCMLSLLIPGPRSPGNEIDVYLEPLIEELKILWHSGVETYDASNSQNSEEFNEATFQTVLGKEKSGQVRCYGRSITPSALKKDKEIDGLKRTHAEEVVSLKGKVQRMEAHVNELTTLVKILVQQNNPGASLDAMMAQFRATISDANSTRNVPGQVHAPSSQATHVPNNEQENLGGEKEKQGDGLLDEHLLNVDDVEDLQAK